MGSKKNNLKEDTIICFGLHKGKKLKEIPDSYFEHLLSNAILFKGIKNYAKRRLGKI